MNILYRAVQNRPVIRIVDVELSYEATRHSSGVVYNPPTTPGFCAPEVMHGSAPDSRADVFSLGWVLYTLIAGYGWTWGVGTSEAIARDAAIDAELRAILLTAVQQSADRRYQSIGEMSGALAAYLESIWPGGSDTPRHSSKEEC
jgi:serine/threonine protein kinase